MLGRVNYISTKIQIEDFYKMTLFVRLMGGFISKIFGLHVRYRNNQITRLFGENVSIQYPYFICGINNIHCGESINIGVNSTIMSTRASIILKGHFVSGPNLTIITGDHMPIIGKFMDTVSDLDKDMLDVNNQFDQNVIIEEDVWCGSNVTILKGVTIGRGCIIAAGALVTRSMPPYYVVAGIPAKPIKMRWSPEQILEHERKLYPEKDCLTVDQINLNK